MREITKELTHRVTLGLGNKNTVLVDNLMQITAAPVQAFFICFTGHVKQPRSSFSEMCAGMSRKRLEGMTCCLSLESREPCWSGWLLPGVRASPLQPGTPGRCLRVPGCDAAGEAP